MLVDDLMIHSGDSREGFHKIVVNLLMVVVKEVKLFE